jgi:hypothetical protein
LSEIYFAYDFTDIKNEDLDTFLDQYLSDMKDRNILKEKDFMPFSFFLSQYAYANDNISKSSMSMILHLFDIFNNYYLTVRDADPEKEKSKKFTLLSVHFFNLTRIILKTDNNILKKYFEMKDGVLKLKEAYAVDTG